MSVRAWRGRSAHERESDERHESSGCAGALLGRLLAIRKHATPEIAHEVTSGHAQVLKSLGVFRLLRRLL